MTLSILDNTNTSTTSGDPLVELVGDGKKFKTVEDLARGKIESDRFIAQLQAETAQLRQELNARQTVEEQIKNLSTQKPPEPPANTSVVTTSTQTPLDEKAIDARVEQLLSQRSRADAASANKSAVDSQLLKHFNGDVNKAREAVAAAERELGVTVADIAAASPQAALRILGITGGGSYVSERGTATSIAGVPNGEPVRNKAYYDKLKTELGNTKFLMNTKLQNQMHKDAQTLGDAFYNK